MTTGVRPVLDATLQPALELIEAYARAHGRNVRFWVREGGGWSLAAGAGPGEEAEPGPGAAEVKGAPGGGAWVEIEGGEEAASAAGFLANVVADALRQAADSRFFGREIADRYEEITLLYTISEILGSVISLEEAAATILSEVTDTMGVRRAALWIHDVERGVLDLVASVGGDSKEEPVAVDDEDSITAAVFRERRPMILESDDVFPRDESYPLADRDSFLSVPVSYTPPHGEPRTIGVINLIGRRLEETFSAGDQKLITAIASQIGAAVENSRLVADSLVQERLVREMELAHDLQLKLLPSASHFRDHAHVAARCSPADSVGGDFYHLFRLPQGRLGVMIGDVSSHGFPAALIMALTMSAVAIHAAEGDPPAEVLRRVHGALIGELESTEMYLTLFYSVIDPERRTLTYANAGHSHAFRITPEAGAERLAVTNPPFGIVDLDDYGERTVDWRPETDLLFLFTDGLSDAGGQHEGERRLVDVVVEGQSGDLDELIERIFSLGQVGEPVPADDRTAVLVRL